MIIVFYRVYPLTRLLIILLNYFILHVIGLKVTKMLIL